MSKNELVMVVRKDALFKENYFQGFSGIEKEDYNKIISNNYEFKVRNKIEEDLMYKQPIAYTILVDNEKRILIHLRKGGDKRLQNWFTLGIGGHVKPSDIKKNNPLFYCAIREINEEIKIKESTTPELVGWVNDDKINYISSFHFGAVYILKTKLNDIKIKEKENLCNKKIIKLGDLKNLHSKSKIKLESWGGFCLNSIEDYLK